MSRLHVRTAGRQRPDRSTMRASRPRPRLPDVHTCTNAPWHRKTPLPGLLNPYRKHVSPPDPAHLAELHDGLIEIGRRARFVPFVAIEMDHQLGRAILAYRGCLTVREADASDALNGPVHAGAAKLE